MAISVYIGNADKRINSTLQPVYTDWLKVDVVLKVDTDLDAPVFVLDLATTSYPQYNYLVIPALNSYYWISDIVSLGRNRWELHANIDVLATLKTDILSTSAYIEYGNNTDASAAAQRVRDTRQNIAEVPSISTSGGPLADWIDPITGVFILSAVGSSSGVINYAMTLTQLRWLTSTLNEDITTAIDDVITSDEPLENIQEILKFFSVNRLSQGDCLSAVRNCYWLPVSKSAISTGALIPVSLGDFKTRVTAELIGENPLLLATKAYPIPWPVDDWRRMNCQGIIYVPYIGAIGIPVEQCNNATEIAISLSLDVLSGDVAVLVEARNDTGRGYPLYNGSVNLSASYAIGVSNVPTTQFAAGAITAIGGAIQAGGGAMGIATGSWIPGMGDAAFTNIGQGMQRAAEGYIQAVTPVIQCVGNLGGAAASGLPASVNIRILYYPPIDNDSFRAVYAHPVFRVATPVAGYCKTRGFSIAADTRSTDLIAVNNMMDGGVFIE